MSLTLLPCRLNLGPYLSGVGRTIHEMTELLKPEIAKRRSELEQYGDEWTDRPVRTVWMLWRGSLVV